MLVTTDMTLSPEEVIRTYALRWSIEVYFKICKSYLGLNDCHSTSYDALTCRMVITAIRHMFLVVQRFRNNDKRSIEQIFAQAKREVAGLLLNARCGRKYLKGLRIYQCRELKIHTEEPFLFHGDGESSGDRIHDLEVGCIERKVRMIL